MTAPASEVDNKLESMLNGLPSEVQSIVRPLTSPFVEAIEMVSGDPDDLCRAAEAWRGAATQVRDVRAQHVSDVERTQQRWKGDASDAFGAKSHEVETSLDGMAKNLESTANLLVQAAQGCAESANLILDILVDLVVFLVSDLLVSLALTAVSAGASLAAGAAGAAARAAASFSKVVKVVGELARLLDRLREMLQKLKAGLEVYRDGFELLKTLKKGTSLFKAEGLMARVGKSAYTAPVRVPVGLAADHSIPGGAAGAAYGIGKDVYKYAQSRTGEIIPPSDQGK